MRQDVKIKTSDLTKRANFWTNDENLKKDGTDEQLKNMAFSLTHPTILTFYK